MLSYTTSGDFTRLHIANLKPTMILYNQLNSPPDFGIPKYLLKKL